MFRPTQARWFETYVPREQTVRATEVLAATGVVQLETDPRLAEPVAEDKLRFFVEQFRSLAARHGHELPGTGTQASDILGDPVHLANQALHRLRVWSARMDFLNAHLEHLRAELRQLDLLEECLAAMARANLDLDAVFHKTRFLCKCLFACPKGGAGEAELKAGVDRVIPGEGHDFLYVADLPDQRHAIRHWVVERGCEQMGIPAWLSGDRANQWRTLARRAALLRRERADLEHERRALRRDPDMARARANVDTLHWYLGHAAGTLTAGPFCHVTGWTTAPDPRYLRQALEKAGIRAVLRSPHPPEQARVPVATLDNWWARPFQPFLVMWGTPDSMTVDPTPLLPFIVPLLFGYMFPDLGHGLVLALLGLALWGRHPRLRFLLTCGLASAGFGLLFGEVFGFHHFLTPLWLRPLEAPEAVLLLPLPFGAGLMLLGLVFAGVEAYWRGELFRWLPGEGAVLVLYLSLLAGLLAPWALVLAGLALLQYLAHAVHRAWRDERWASVLESLGSLALSLFELAMNTLSFLRVGAFALAHGALSLAVLTLADGTGSAWAWWAVVIAGNVFALTLEGLLVFVQTTRLVLFEFFVRFLEREGRLFRPAPGPGAG